MKEFRLNVWFCTLLVALVVIFTLGVQKCLAEWIALEPLATIPGESISGWYNGGGNGQGLFVMPEYHFPQFRSNEGNFLVLYDLNTGHRVWERLYSTADAMQVATFFSHDSVVVVNFGAGSVHSRIYDSAGNMIRDWDTLSFRWNIDERSFVRDDNNYIYFIPGSIIGDTVWYLGKYHAVSRSMQFLLVAPISTIRDSLVYRKITPDQQGGAFIWLRTTWTNHVFHVLADGNVIGPNYMYTVAPPNEERFAGFTYSRNTQHLFYLKWDTDTSFSSIAMTYPISTTFQLGAPWVRRSINPLWLGGQGTLDTTWMFHRHTFYNDTTGFYETSHLLLYANATDSSWVRTDSILGRFFSWQTENTSEGFRIFCDPPYIVLLYGNHAASRRILNSEVSNGFAGMPNKTSFDLYPNPTNGYLSISNLLGRGGSWALYDILGREVGYGFFPIGNVRTYIKFPTNLSSGNYWLITSENGAPIRSRSITLLR